MKISKGNIVSNRAIVLVFLATQENEFYNIFSEIEMNYKIEIMEILQFIKGSENDLNAWVKNCKKYLVELSQRYNEIILVGYGIGSILAGNCAVLPFIKKVILLEPKYEYFSNLEYKNECYEREFMREVASLGINKNLFSIIFLRLVESLESQIRLSSAKVIIIQRIEDSSITTARIDRLYLTIDRDNFTVIRLGLKETSLFASENSRAITLLLLRYHLKTN
ncbi:MAG: hypothetical protein ACK5L6_09610 [Anaerorhabdus sp.]|uniref:hypothetical protein n=1 Tax=Anaerorhabdus sp. TaxID=1872524 RepID=UPI003A8A2C16